MNKPETYDGDLVMVAPNAFESGQKNINLFFRNEALGQFVPVDEKPLGALARLHRVRQFPHSGQVMKKFEAWVKEAKKNVEKRQHPEVYETIEEGRLRFSMLLDTDGGLAMYRQVIGSICDYLEVHGGSVHSFGGPKIMSLGAYLLMFPPKKQRFVLPDSRVLFHLGMDKNGSREEKLPEEHQDEVDEIRRVLLADTIVSKRKHMEGIVDDAFSYPASPDCPILLTGSQMAWFGMVRQTQSLSKEFQGIHKVSGDTYRKTPINDFFRKCLPRQLRGIIG